MDDSLLRISDVAAALDVTWSEAKSLVTSGKILAYRIGDGSWRVRRSDLDAYMQFQDRYRGGGDSTVANAAPALANEASHLQRDASGGDPTGAV